MTNPSRAACALLLCVASSCITTSVRAYERTRPVGKVAPARWLQPAVYLRLDTEMVPEGMSRDDVLNALQRAARSWSHPETHCSSLEVTVVDGSAALSGGVRDGVNSVSFHARHWCRGGLKRSGNCYQPRRAALTTVHFGEVIAGSDEIEIVEVDIELNARDFSWTTAADNVGPHLDLETVLVHELGHAIGLAHVCAHSDASSSARRRVPACPRASNDTTKTSVMMPAADSLTSEAIEVRRTLSSDDRRAVCNIYPALPRSPPAPSSRSGSESGCACNLSSRPTTSGPVPAGLLSLLALAIRFRTAR